MSARQTGQIVGRVVLGAGAMVVEVFAAERSFQPGLVAAAAALFAAGQVLRSSARPSLG